MKTVFLGSEAIDRNEVTRGQLRWKYRAIYPDVYEDAPVELLWRNNRPPEGIITRNDHFLCDDVMEFNGMAVATPQRTAYELGRYLRRDAAVIHLDALSRVTGLAADHVASLIDRYKGARGIRNLRTAVDLMDGGAQSPKETELRLLLIDAGSPDRERKFQSSTKPAMCSRTWTWVGRT